MRIHVVKKGESLFSIAQQYGVSARLLQKQNEVPADGTLVTGQNMSVRVGGVWKQSEGLYCKTGGVWRRGETLFAKNGGVWRQA